MLASIIDSHSPFRCSTSLTNFSTLIDCIIRKPLRSFSFGVKVHVMGDLLMAYCFIFNMFLNTSTKRNDRKWIYHQIFAFKWARGKLEIVDLMQREWDLNVLLISFCKYYKTLFLCLLWTWEVVKLLSILLSSLQIAFVVVHWTLSFATTRFFFDYYRSWIIAFIRTSSSSVDRQINFLCIFNLITVVVARHTLKSIINTWADRTQRSTWRE